MEDIAAIRLHRHGRTAARSPVALRPQLVRAHPENALQEQRINPNVKQSILCLLARTAPHLSFDYVRRSCSPLVLPPPSAGYEVELAAVVGSHPWLLTAMPELRDYLYAADPARSTTVVAVLWRAEAHATGSDRTNWRYCGSRSTAMSRSRCRSARPLLRPRVRHVPAGQRAGPLGHVQPRRSADILRPARATTWTVSRRRMRSTLRTTWPDSSADFVPKYLLSRAVVVRARRDPVAVLRDLAGS